MLKCIGNFLCCTLLWNLHLACGAWLCGGSGVVHQVCVCCVDFSTCSPYARGEDGGKQGSKGSRVVVSDPTNLTPLGFAFWSDSDIVNTRWVQRDVCLHVGKTSLWLTWTDLSWNYNSYWCSAMFLSPSGHLLGPLSKSRVSAMERVNELSTRTLACSVLCIEV